MHLNWLEYYVLSISDSPDEEFVPFIDLLTEMNYDVSGNPRQYLDNTMQLLLACKKLSDEEGVVIKSS